MLVIQHKEVLILIGNQVSDFSRTPLITPPLVSTVPDTQSWRGGVVHDDQDRGQDGKRPVYQLIP